MKNRNHPHPRVQCCKSHVYLACMLTDPTRRPALSTTTTSTRYWAAITDNPHLQLLYVPHRVSSASIFTTQFSCPVDSQYHSHQTGRPLSRAPPLSTIDLATTTHLQPNYPISFAWTSYILTKNNMASWSGGSTSLWPSTNISQGRGFNSGFNGFQSIFEAFITNFGWVSRGFQQVPISSLQIILIIKFKWGSKVGVK